MGKQTETVWRCFMGLKLPWFLKVDANLQVTSHNITLLKSSGNYLFYCFWKFFCFSIWIRLFVLLFLECNKWFTAFPRVILVIVDTYTSLPPHIRLLIDWLPCLYEIEAITKMALITGLFSVDKRWKPV